MHTYWIVLTTGWPPNNYLTKQDVSACLLDSTQSNTRATCRPESCRPIQCTCILMMITYYRIWPTHLI